MHMDISRSTMSWTGRAAEGGFELSGEIKPAWGELKGTEKEIHRGEIRVDMNSLVHEYADLVKHLKNEDFFEVDKHPFAHFKLADKIVIGAACSEVKGTLTIRGVEMPAKSKVKIKESASGLSCDFEMVIDRTTFGSTYNSPSASEDAGEHGIADEFAVTGTLFFPWPGPGKDH